VGIEAAATLSAALQLLPNTKHVLVVGGTGPFDRQQVQEVSEQLRNHSNQVEISYATDFTMPELLKRLRSLSKDSIIIFTAMSRDAAGTLYSSRETGPLVDSAASVPVFSLFDLNIGYGQVGGNLSKVRAQGTIAGDAALKILAGVSPRDIPVAKAPNGFVFDWLALKRWGLEKNSLPPGSTVLNRQPTAWESYRGYFIGGLSLILLEALLISGLLLQRSRAREAEIKLSNTYDRLRLALDAGKSVGWDWDLKSGRDRWFGDLETVFGIPSDTYSGHVDDFHRRVHSEDRDSVWRAVADARHAHKPYIAEFRVIREDGSVRWISARGKFYYAANGDAERMLGMAVDITERKQAEEALANLTGRLIKAQEEERSRVAREIHDDYNQRLALVANDLDGLREILERSTSLEASQRLHELWNQVSELASDLHDLSHRLHSSTLERLGLVAGVRAFCKEFGDHQGLRVDFTHENVPPSVPPDAALCLFRIAQEALRNVKRHSGADSAEVRLEWRGEKLHLSVTDKGRGFYRHSHSAEAGIGIQSMEERLRLVGGHLEIHSRPSEGTKVDAWLPLEVAGQRAS
jgi:signal transduction histidine kinase